MYSFREFVQWFTRSSDKAEKVEFKTQREAAEFVRRIYNESGQPNSRLRALYRRGAEIEREGISVPLKKRA